MKDKPNWESMCRALYWTIEMGNGSDLDEIMDHIEQFIKNEDSDG